MSIHTILFDLDGTLIDTNELIIASFHHTFSEFNHSFTKEQIMEFNGPPLMDTFMHINPAKAEQMVAAYRVHNHANHDNFVRAFPHVKETIHRLKEEHIKLGIVSTKMRDGVEMGLLATGLDNCFEAIVTYDDVENPKPHAEPVLRGMEKLGGHPDTTLMVGDNYHDIEAGNNAGVQTAGVAWAHKGKERLLSYGPTYMLEDMRDLLKIIGVN
ncbi:pyrophosphatase PpaX [Virgibacillus xinjiangensis]|uniref:Pyrophosphatase PpaX n=1 Tax=Virgibacillus xinjiangensis TaxID=393090 RepID=A0ABV7CXT8_9BACI